jgi:hypothetical protein
MYFVFLSSCKSLVYVDREISNTVLKQLRLIRCFKIISVSELSPLMQIKYGMQQIIQDLVLRFGKSKKFESKITKDSLPLEFRSIAQTATSVLLSVANPALLYQVSKKNLKPRLTYQENNKKVFYDSMKFWNNKEGIAMGDPIADFLSIIVTRDGGNTWNKLPADKLPRTANGEAAFAATPI